MLRESSGEGYSQGMDGVKLRRARAHKQRAERERHLPASYRLRERRDSLPTRTQGVQGVTA